VIKSGEQVPAPREGEPAKKMPEGGKKVQLIPQPAPSSGLLIDQ
jgi:hypothetical protein